MNSKPKDVFEIASGDVYCWAEAGTSVMLKAVTAYGDPVELGSEEAIELANALLKAAKAVE
jgi:hypothetical protein